MDESINRRTHLRYKSEEGEGNSEWPQGEFNGGGGNWTFSVSAILSFVLEGLESARLLLRSLWYEIASIK